MHILVLALEQEFLLASTPLVNTLINTHILHKTLKTEEQVAVENHYALESDLRLPAFEPG